MSYKQSDEDFVNIDFLIIAIDFYRFVSIHQIKYKKLLFPIMTMVISKKVFVNKLIVMRHV